MPQMSWSRRSRHLPVFRRDETPLAHAVYGLILTMATLGELINHEIGAGEAVLWLLGGGALLLTAHVFSAALAHLAVTHDEPRWAEIVRIGREELAVVIGSVGSALVMIVAALVGLRSGRALAVCVIVGLATLAWLSIRASVNHGWSTRLLMGGSAVGLGGFIVLLENVL